MASRYPSQNFELYPHPHWPTDAKSSFIEDEEASVLGDQIHDPTSPAISSAPTMSRKASMIKDEDAYYSADSVWHEGQHEGAVLPVRHHTQPQINTHHQPYMRIDPSYAAAYTNPQAWPMSANSGTSTPTPIFTAPGYVPSQSMGYPGFTPINQQDHTSSEMSPQSSQGGWGSTTSSDSTEHPARRMRSSGHRAMSPMSVMRPDGIRKKNARFEIPRDRNLNNIDSLISATTDEIERKELKQQKRLLRNRQAALDSRQRKKSHTEKLEQEKKIWADEKQGLEDNITRAHEHYQAEIMQVRAQYDYHLRELEYQRDEAIRTKTTETQDLRRQNNALKEVVRDLENQRRAHQYAASAAADATQSHHDNYTPDFNSFDQLGLDDWDAGSLFGNEDFNKMDHSSQAQQVTPKPIPAKMAVDASKSDLPFSWNAFYMCLLFGAFIASKSNSSTTSSQLQARIPDLSEDYRAEAGAVLKAVLASTPESAGSLFPGASSTRHQQQPAASALDAMHSTLTTPSRHQELVSAFSLSAASYNHINNPEGLDLHDNDENDAMLFSTPTPLERQFADMQAQRAEVERVLNRQSEGRSVLWDRVPAKVLRDFREMVGALD